jgi:hypothetical protein
MPWAVVVVLQPERAGTTNVIGQVIDRIIRPETLRQIGCCCFIRVPVSPSLPWKQNVTRHAWTHIWRAESKYWLRCPCCVTK